MRRHCTHSSATVQMLPTFPRPRQPLSGAPAASSTLSPTLSSHEGILSYISERESKSHSTTTPQRHSATGPQDEREGEGQPEWQWQRQRQRQRVLVSVSVCLPATSPSPTATACSSRMMRRSHRRIRLDSGSKLKPRDSSKSNLPAPVNFLFFWRLTRV